MNQQAYEAGKAAYKQGDFLQAVTQLSQAKFPGEVSGEIDHLLGNCLMKLGRFDEAAVAYGEAAADSSYGHAGALACNRGRALLAANKPQEAIAALNLATQDPDYPTPYKAHVALGKAYTRIGNVREAGVAYRNAAIDESNPDPSSALRNLGGCFMQMGRAVDAVEAYRTALDFSTPLADQNVIFADLGLAYVAANRMGEAVDAFNHATADGNLTLTPEAQAAYDAARKAISAISGDGPSETDAFLKAAGYGTGAIDPLDPTGSTGEFMPSPEDTGFFSIKEEDIVAQDKRERKVRRKKKRGGAKVLIVILVLLIALIGVGGFAYFQGYGWPTQESVVQGLFGQGSSHGDVASYLDSSVSNDARQQIESVLPANASSVSVEGIDRSMSSSKVLAKATLSAGGEQSYEIEMVRSGIGWKVSKVTAIYSSQEGQAKVSDGSSSTSSSSTTSGTISNGQ